MSRHANGNLPELGSLINNNVSKVRKRKIMMCVKDNQHEEVK